jgi:hypothetical protein
MSGKWPISSPQLAQIAALKEEVARLRGKLALVRRDILAKDLIAAYEHSGESAEDAPSDPISDNK